MSLISHMFIKKIIFESNNICFEPINPSTNLKLFNIVWLFYDRNNFEYIIRERNIFLFFF